MAPDPDHHPALHRMSCLSCCDPYRSGHGSQQLTVEEASQVVHAQWMFESRHTLASSSIRLLVPLLFLQMK